MNYDADLRKQCRVAIALVVVNLTAALLNAGHGDWLVAGACVGWALSCKLMHVLFRQQQRTRDQGRIIEAGLHAMREQLEREE